VTRRRGDAKNWETAAEQARRSISCVSSVVCAARYVALESGAARCCHRCRGLSIGWRYCPRAWMPDGIVCNAPSLAGRRASLPVVVMCDLGNTRCWAGWRARRASRCALLGSPFQILCTGCCYAYWAPSARLQIEESRASNAIADAVRREVVPFGSASVGRVAVADTLRCMMARPRVWAFDAGRRCLPRRK